MLCGRELTGLLVNIFPTSSWDDDKGSFAGEIIDDVHALDAALLRLEASSKHHYKANSQHTSPSNKRGVTMFANNHAASSEWNSVNNFSVNMIAEPVMCPSFSGEYIGSLILSLVSKMELEDSSITIGPDAGCVTLNCLQFASEMYIQMPTNSAFSETYQQVLHRRLLAIICGCISTTFAKPPTQNPIDMADFLDRMLETGSQIFESINEHRSAILDDHLRGLCVFVALCLQKCVQQTDFALFDTIDCLIAKHFQLLIDVFAINNSLKFLSLLLKLVQSLRTRSATESLSKRRCSSRKRSQLLAHAYSAQHHFQHSHRLACTLERLVLRLAQHMTSRSQMCLVFRHFHHNRQCCCNTDLDNMTHLISTSRQSGTLKQCLQFVRYNILRTTFASSVACEVCDHRRLAFTSGYAFYQMYLDIASTYDASTVLKHVANIAKLLPFDMSCRMMIELLLPTFRREKARLVGATDGNTEIVSLCLNAFLCYLRDIRLIRGFFNDENIQHLADLVVVPEFASLVCCLLKIGLDNESFLGENCGEQLVLAEKLRQMRSRSLLIVSDAMNHMFRAIQSQERGRIQLRCVTTDEIVATNELIDQLQSRHLSAYNLLQLAVIYWNMLLQMLRRNSDRKLAKAALPMCVSRQEQEIVVCLVQNALNCFLYTQTSTMGDDDLCIERTRYIWMAADELVDDAALSGLSNAHVPNTLPKLYDIRTDSLSCANSDIYNSETSDTYPAGFSPKLTSDSEMVFDLRLSKNDTHTTSSSFSLIYAPIDSASASVDDNGILRKCEMALAETDAKQPSAVQNVLQFLSENVLEVLFPATQVDSESGDGRIKQEEQTFGDAIGVHTIVTSAEHKKLFLQLFEITCGVLMSAVQQAAIVEAHECE